MKHLVIFTGAGISAESGIRTFRDSDGLWENYEVMEVASIQGWYKNKALILDFYNHRRQQLEEVEPNLAHLILAKLEKEYKVTIITQNVDNLHERAGSSNVIHLHGELTKVCNADKDWVRDIGYKEIHLGDEAPDHTQLRPFIVWFGEEVPLMETAIDAVERADLFLIIGTSLEVYPAASLLHYAPKEVPVFLIDPKPATNLANVRLIPKRAVEGMADFTRLLQDWKADTL